MVIIGSPTVGNNMIHGMAGFIDLMRSLKFKRKLLPLLVVMAGVRSGKNNE